MARKTFLQRIVKNDAMKNDPPEIYGWRVFALAGSGMLLSNQYPSVNINYMMCHQVHFR